MRQLVTLRQCPALKWILRNKSLPKCHIHVWALCGDCGPDQCSFRASIRTLLSQPRFESQLVFEIPCLKHQLHLMCKDMMTLTNKMLGARGRGYGYFGAVAKICHTWRAHGIKVNKTWQAVVPGAWEFKASCSVPPLAVAGRWGSIDCVQAILQDTNSFFTSSERSSDHVARKTSRSYACMLNQIDLPSADCLLRS